MAVSPKWRLSAFEYKIDFLIIPVLLGLALAGSRPAWLQLLFGLLGWTLAEYAAHRFALHRHFRQDHWAHHLAPHDYIGISGLHIGFAYALLLWPARLLGLQWAYAGFLLGYLAYVSVHYALHRPHFCRGRLLSHLARHHAMHHQRGIEQNFGVTSPLWDVLCRTYSRSA